MIVTFFRTCWCYSEAYNTGTQKWSSIFQYSCTSIWDLKYTFSFFFSVFFFFFFFFVLFCFVLFCFLFVCLFFFCFCCLFCFVLFLFLFCFVFCLFVFVLFCFCFVLFLFFCFLFLFFGVFSPCFVRVCFSFAFFNSCEFEQSYRLVCFYLLLIYSRHRPFTFFLLFCVYLNCIS